MSAWVSFKFTKYSVFRMYIFHVQSLHNGCMCHCYRDSGILLLHGFGVVKPIAIGGDELLCLEIMFAGYPPFTIQLKSMIGKVGRATVFIAETA
jgi:hypothetical protein